MTFQRVLERPTWSVHRMVCGDQCILFDALSIALSKKIADVLAVLYFLEKYSNKLSRKHTRCYSDKLEGGDGGVKQAASTVTWWLDEVEEAELVKTVQGVAAAAYSVLGCTDFSQIDCRVTSTGQVFVLEANTFCSFGPLSLMTKLAGRAGIKGGELYARMVDSAVSRGRKNMEGAALRSG